MDVRKAQPVTQVVYWTTTQDGLEEAALSAQSVRETCQGCQIHLYADKSLPPVDFPDWTYRMDFSRWPLMVGNLVAQTDYMLRHHRNGPVAFLDTDILVRKALYAPSGVDLAVTFRDYVGFNEQGEKVEGVAKTMPYNYGVVLANPTVPAVEAFLWMRDRIPKMNPEAQRWYGNQLALRELVGLERGQRLPYVTIRALPWTQVMVKVLDADEWNYSPEGPDEDVSKRRILHLKGNRKPLMRHYLERILGETT
jgi:hypothetical protein